MSVDLGTARGQIVIDTKDVETAMRQAGASMSKFQAGATVAMAGVAAATGAMAAAVKVAQKAWESFERGADLAAAQSRFERLTESINSTSDAMLGRLREATNGMMSDAALIASANDIMSLGLAKTEDQTVRLATVVGKLGWDMQQTILTFANNSKLRLDALGLSIEDVNARTKALQAQGMSLDAAFDLAVIEAGEAKIKLLGDASQTTKGKIQQLETVWKNTRDAFDQAFAEGLAESMDQIAGSAQAMGPALEAASAGLGRFASKWASSAIFTSPIFRDLLVFGLQEQAKALQEAEEQARASSAEVERAATVAFNRTAKAARNANTEYAQAARLLDEYGAAANRVTRELELHYNRGDAAAARNRQILADTGKTVYELAQMGLTAEQYLEQVSEQAAKAAEEAADRYHRAFASVQADFITTLENADDPLVAFGDALAGTGDTAAGLAVNMDAVNQAIYEQLAGMPGAEQAAIAFAVSTDIMSEAQGRAALAAAAVAVKIEELAGKIAAGLPIEAAMTQLDTFIAKIESGVNPAAATMAADVPQHIADMKDRMAEEAMLAGETVPANLEAGMRENLDTVETAAGDMATAVIDATRAAFGVESPSTVFAEIGGDLMAGLGEGMTEAEAEMLAIVATIGEETVAVWDETIAAMPDVGEAIIDGVIAGIEARRQALIDEMSGIGSAAYQAAMDAIQASSPSRLFMSMGESIIDGIAAGLDAEKETLYDKLNQIAGKLFSIGNRVFDLQADALAGQIETAAAGLDQALGALSPFASDAVIGNLRDMTPAQQAEALRGLRGRSAFQGDPEAARRLEEAIRLADERNRLEQEHIRQQEELKRLEEQRAQLDFLKTQVDLLNLIRDNGLDASILDGLTLGLDANMGDIIAAMTAAVQQLVERTNEELDINSPSKVFAEIGANVMAGFAEGLRETAAAEAMVRQAMSDVAAVGAIEGARTADAVTDSIEKGLAYTGSATDLLRELAGGLGRSGLADPRRLEARLREAAGRVIRVDARGLNPAQTVNIYGGYNVQLRDRASAEPLRELYYEGLGYQG